MRVGSCGVNGGSAGAWILFQGVTAAAVEALGGAGGEVVLAVFRFSQPAVSNKQSASTNMVPQVRPSFGLTWDFFTAPRLASKRRTRTWGTNCLQVEESN